MIQAIAVIPDRAHRGCGLGRKCKISETETGKEVHSFRMAAGIDEKKSLTYSPEGHIWRVLVKSGRKDIWDTRTYLQSPG